MKTHEVEVIVEDEDAEESWNTEFRVNRAEYEVQRIQGFRNDRVGINF